MLTLFVALTATAPAASLSIEGECPGLLELRISDVAPGADVYLLFGGAPGSDPVPSGPCEGIDSSLERLARQFGPFRADVSGEYVIARAFGGALCPRYASVLDTNTCTASRSVPLAGGVSDFPHDNGLGVVWFNEVPTGTIDEAQAQLSCEASYPGECERRDGDCAGPGWCYYLDGGYEPCWGWEAGCSGSAGRVWEYGSSYTTYGYWD